MGISEIERGEVASTQSWGAVKHGLDPKWVGGIYARLEMGDWFNTVDEITMLRIMWYKYQKSYKCGKE